MTIEITQAGQYGSSDLLYAMHRMRARVFRERLGWDVTVSNDGLETDQFDIPEAIYLLAVDSQQDVRGSWRILRSDGPTMIRDIWPETLESLPFPSSPLIWELSRFAVDSSATMTTDKAERVSAQMICAFIELCILCGVTHAYTLYDVKIARLLKRMNCLHEASSRKFLIDGNTAQMVRFKTDLVLLEKVRLATGLQDDLIDSNRLPQALAPYLAIPEPERQYG